MKKLLGQLLHPRAITVAALLLLSLVIYFGGRVLRERGFLPGTWSDSVLLLLAASVWAIAAAVFAYRRQQAQKGSRMIQQRLRAQAQEQVASVRPDRKPEIEALEKRFEEALASLNGSRLGKRALYALPWYVIVGPPGSGKSTLLKESSLDFPHMGQGGRGIRGIGGTRNCDWWFTDQGILLDTAGRYTTEAEDHDEWLAFLDMLAKARKHEPINGAIVAISVQDIVDAKDEELVQHSTRIRNRLAELSQELDMVFPIYLVFTKCDLLAGFVETFGGMNRQERAQVWGTTLTPALRQGRPVAEVVAGQVDALHERLCEQRLALLALDRPGATRQRIHSFPLQFLALRERLVEFVGLLGRPDPYHDGAELRGVYFTSGTQEGTPIDRVLAAMSEAFGFEPESERGTGGETTTKSYFIDDLLTKVVFRDKDLAHRSARVQRRQILLRRVASYGAAAALLIALVMLFSSYFRNRAAIQATSALLAQAPVLATRNDGAPTAQQIEVMAALHRAFLPLHADHYLGSFLLGRDDELYTAVRAVYVDALRRYFIAPCQNYLMEDLDRRIHTEGKMDYRATTHFNKRIELFALFGGEPGNADQMVQWIREENLWNWREDQIGQARTLGAERSEDIHLDAFHQIAGGVSQDWVVAPDSGVLADARAHLAHHNKAAKVVELAIQDGASIDPTSLAGIGIGRSEPIPGVFATTLEEAITAATTRLAPLSGSEEDIARARERMKKEWTSTWRKALSRYRPEPNEFRNLSEARKSLRTYTGTDSPYVRYYNVAREKLREAGELSEVIDDPAFDREWLTKALEEIAKLDEPIGTFLAGTAAQQRVLPDLRRGAEQIKILLQAFARTRDSIDKIVTRYAEHELRREAATALAALVGALETAFAKEAIVELETHWSAIASRLQAMLGRYPFAPEAAEDVPIDAFAVLLHRGGEFDAAVAPLLQLADMKVGGLPVVRLTATFAEELRRIRQIQQVMFAADSPTASIDFKLTLDVGKHVAEVLLSLSGHKEISSKKEPRTRKRFGGLDCRWEQADQGAAIRIRLADTEQTLLAQPQGGAAAGPNTPWRFFRVLHGGSPQVRGTTLHCEWVFPYHPSGSAPSTRNATAELTTTGPNPFAPGCFSGFTFPTRVFQADE